MYNVIRIYVVSAVTVTPYDTDEITPHELQQLAEVNTHFYISVKDTVNLTNHDIDYSELIMDKDMEDRDTWAKVSAVLTQELVQGYAATIPGYEKGKVTPRDPIITWDVMNTLNTFDVTYADHISELAGLFAYRWKLADLQIDIQKGSSTYPDLHRCIPVVNGIVCRPYFSTISGKLYALDGAKMCWQSGTHVTPEVELLDFGYIGDITVSTLVHNTEVSKETNVTTITNKKISLHTALTFTSKQFSLSQYRPIPVLCGIPIWPDDIEVTGDYTFKVTLNTHPLERALAWRAYMSAAVDTTSEISYTTSDVCEYIHDECTKKLTDPSHSCFVIWVKTPSLHICRRKVSVWENGIILDAYTPDGILVRDNTETITVNHKNAYDDRNELLLQNQETVLISDASITKLQDAFIEPRCTHHDFEELQSGNYHVIYVMK